MLKITDPDYFLPLVEALQGVEELGTGTTKPMLVRGVCSTTHEKHDYVVKYHSAPRMSVEASCRELLAAFIAKQLEMNVAEPALIHVSTDFADSLRGKDGWLNANNSIGINYGCKYVEGYMQFVQNPKLNTGLRAQAEEIFALDIFISNADRRTEKQNMLTNGENIVIFDHELAFGFVMDIVKNVTPWLIQDKDKEWIKNHFFYNILRENEPNFESFVDRFKVLDAPFWAKTSTLIPKAWQTSQMEGIKSNLNALIENKATFLKELYKILK